MSGLPMGWVGTTIVDVGSTTEQAVLTGPFGASLGKADFTASGVPVFTIGCLGNSSIIEDRIRYVSPEKAGQLDAYRLRECDLLFSRMATVGRIGIVPRKFSGGIFNYHLMRLRLSSSAILQRFFYHYIRGSECAASYLADRRRGATRDGINTKLLEELPVLLPPLAEQKRIVAKLDALTAKSARARAELARIDTLVSRYKQAVLGRAYNGAFTEAWRQQRNVSRVERTQLKDVCLSISDGDHQAPPKVASGVPFITISAMADGEIDVSKATRYVTQKYFDNLHPARRANVGDVLYSVTGSYGIPALVKSEMAFVFQRHIAVLRPNTKLIDSRYLANILASPDVKGQADKTSTGTAQKTVALGQLRKFTIWLPSIEEQHEIVRRIETAFARIDRLAAEAKRALALLGKLDEAILAKAFRGELVPQDPADEPASVLLDRIRIERAAAPKAKRGRRTAAVGLE